MVGQRNHSEGLQKSEYRPSELHNISVAFSTRSNWALGGLDESKAFLYTEAGERWVGSWSEGSEVSINRNGETIIGTAYTFKSDKGNLVTVWDSNGILLSWSSVILGVSVEGEINKNFQKHQTLEA